MIRAAQPQRGRVSAASRVAIDDLITTLRALDLHHAGVATVHEVLHATTRDAAALAAHAEFIAQRHTRTCLYRDDDFELLILAWAAGATSSVHDHGESRCFFALVDGVLRVDNFEVIERSETPGEAWLERRATTVLRPGDVDVRESDRDAHRVAPIGGPALSLHVYARPLDRCRVFDLERAIWADSISHYDRILE